MNKGKALVLIVLIMAVLQQINPQFGFSAELNRVDLKEAEQRQEGIKEFEEKNENVEATELNSDNIEENELEPLEPEDITRIESKEETKQLKENKDDSNNDSNELENVQQIKVENREQNEEGKQENNFTISPMAISTPGYYTTDPNAIVVPTTMDEQSTNDHTRAHRLWANGTTVYVAVNSTHTLQYMTLHGVTTTNFDVYDADIKIKIDDKEYEPREGLQGSLHKSHWTVFKFNLSDLNLNDDGVYPFFVKGQGGGHDVGGNLYFEIPKTNVEGKKIWVGGTARPAITLQLIVQVGDEEEKVLRTGIVDGSETPAWTYNWTEVPQYDPYGRTYTFTVDEESVPINYKKSMDGLTVINTYDPKTINIDVLKEWIGPAAQSVTIKLIADGVETEKTIVLDQTNNWSSSFTDLNKYDDKTGDAIIYTVEEVTLPGYSTEKSGSVEEGFTFINTNDETFDIDVTKEWIGPGEDSVNITLIADGTEVKELMLNEDNNWSGKFKNVRRYDDKTGVEIDYTVEELEIPGYTTKKSGSLEEGFTFTNINDETINIDVEKRWVGSKEDSVTIELRSSSEKIGDIVLNDEVNWSGTFENVRKYDATTGEKIVYSVEEINVPENYDVNVTVENGKYIVTNTAKYGSLTINKVDENGDALQGAVFTLTGPEGYETTGTSNADGEIVFENLEWGTYTLVETKAPEGYRLLTGEMEVEITKENLHVTKEVENTRQDWDIPKTGGMGTLGFYGVGLLLMVAAVWFVIRRRQA